MRPDFTPRWLDRVASIGWRYLILLAVIYVTFYVVSSVTVITLPVVLGLFVASVLAPPVQWLKGRGWPPTLAVATTFVGLIPIGALLVALLVPSVADGIGPLGEDVGQAFDSVVDWLADGPLQLSETEISQYVEQGIDQLQENAATITTGVLGGATAAIEVVTGLVLTLLAAFFYLKDGDRGYRALLARVDDPDRVGRGLTAAWRTLSNYVRGLAVVGAVDAVLIGIGLAIVGTPLVVPLMVLVFVGGFFPIVGAFVSGLVAVAVTFVNGGPSAALVVLAIVVGVQQIEGNVLYPIVFKRALSLHPLVILIATGVGGVAFGVIGVFLGVPLTAVAVAAHQAMVDDAEGSPVALMSSAPYERSVDEALRSGEVDDHGAGDHPHVPSAVDE
jgi:putative heme transporter